MTKTLLQAPVDAGGIGRTDPGFDSGSIRLILFDLDGTLVDSVGDLAWCGNQMRQRLGLPVHDERTARDWVGNGVERFVKRVLTGGMETEPPAELYARGVELFRKLYAAHASDRSELYPGVIEALQGLSTCPRNLQLACVTNKDEPFTSRLIREMGLGAFFDLVVAGNTTSHRKPHPGPLHYAADYYGFDYRHCLMIGDSSNDVLAARAAGFAVACVPYGYNHGRDIRQSQPDLVIENLSQLIELFS
jgi:phosphoglycolate phosphatase